MGLGSNLASSVTGKIDKALLCVKKPKAIEKDKEINSMLGDVMDMFPSDARGMIGGSISNVDLQAKVIASQKGFLSGFTSAKTVASKNGYHVMEVKYNPSKIQINASGGNQMMPGPGGAGTNMQVQSVAPAATIMQVELLFDDLNIQDAFMFEKATNITAGSIVTDVAGAVRTAKGNGYTVKHQIEAMIALITQAESRQVVFYWGDMAYAGEVVSVRAKYTMFNPVGHPVRGTVTLSIREGGPENRAVGDAYWNAAYQEMLEGDTLFSQLTGAMGNLINLK